MYLYELCFYPRVRVGRDPSICVPAKRLYSFYPRVRVGRDLATACTLFPLKWFLSARPRGTRPLVSGITSALSQVSIRASAWDATDQHCQDSG